jgi:serine/threonine-protein kinase
VEQILTALETIFAIHLKVSSAGLVAVDLYDGCLHYDFQEQREWLLDADEYRPGPFRVKGGRLPGSRRFLAPEQTQIGALNDERTTVYQLGRVGAVLLDAGDNEGRFRGGPERAQVLTQARAQDPDQRFVSIKAFVTSWRQCRD